MKAILTWKKRPPPLLPFEQETAHVEQYFRDLEEARQYVRDRRRDPDFILLGLSEPFESHYVDRTFTPVIQFSTRKNHEREHLFPYPYGPGGIKRCLKCDSLPSELTACPVQPYDPDLA